MIDSDVEGQEGAALVDAEGRELQADAYILSPGRDKKKVNHYFREVARVRP